MFLSYAPDTLMKQRGLSLLSIEVEIPLLSLGVAEYNGLEMRYVKNTRPPLPRKGGSKSICSRVPSKTAQVETQVGLGRSKDQLLKRKTEGHTDPPKQEGNKQIQPGKLHLSKKYCNKINASLLTYTSSTLLTPTLQSQPHCNQLL